MTDENVLAPLRQEPPAFSAVDVPKAMAEGMRRRRMRRWSGGRPPLIRAADM